MKITVRVQPGSSHASVGGRYGAEDPPVVIVRVAARPVDGQANEAVRNALAVAFGVRARDVVLVSGERSRIKVFDVDGASEQRLAELL